MGMKFFNRRYYSYDFGDVHYVVLDTMLYESNHEDNHDTHHPDLYDVQVQWLRQDLTANTKNGPSFLCIEIHSNMPLIDQVQIEL